MVRSLRSSHTLFNTWSPPPTSPPPAAPPAEQRRSSVWPPSPSTSAAVTLVLDPFQGPSPGAQRLSTTTTTSDHSAECSALSPRSNLSRQSKIRSSQSHSLAHAHAPPERRSTRPHHHNSNTPACSTGTAVGSEEQGLGLHSPAGSAHYLFPTLASTHSGLSGRESIATTLTALTAHTTCTAYTAIDSTTRYALAPSSTAQTLRALVEAVSPRTHSHSHTKAAERRSSPPEKDRDPHRDRARLGRVTVLGPAKRVPSASRLSTHGQTHTNLTHTVENKPDPQTQNHGKGLEQRASMRTLRRQPSMADLSSGGGGSASSLGRSKGLKVQLEREREPPLGVLGEVTNWSLGQAVSGSGKKVRIAIH